MSTSRPVRASLVAGSLLLPFLLLEAGEKSDKDAVSPAARTATDEPAVVTTGAVQLEANPHAAAIREVLATSTSVDFAATPLEDALASVARSHGIQLLIDRPTITEEGVALDQPVTLKLADVTVESILNLICEGPQLTFLVQDEVLKVTTTIKASEHLETKLYDIRRLVSDNSSKALIEVLTDCILPDTWDDVGGPGTIRAVRNGIVVRQTDRVHDEIARILVDLERVISAPAGKHHVLVSLGPNRIAEIRFRDILAERGSLDCIEQPLENVLSSLAEEHGLQLVFDRPRIVEEGVALDQPITLKVNDLRLESILDLLLRGPQLTWVVEHEVLRITTAVKASEKLTTRVYDFRDLAAIDAELIRSVGGVPAQAPSAGQPVPKPGGGVFQAPADVLRQGFGAGVDPGDSHPGPGRLIRSTALVKVIQSTIAPDTWNELGGAGTIQQYRGALVVRQTQRVHAELARWLADVRSVALAGPEPGPARKVPAHDEMTLVVYRLVDDSAEKLVEAIPDVIAPESWAARVGGEGSGKDGLVTSGSATQTTNTTTSTLTRQGTIHRVKNSLLIRQTRAVHDEIARLLKQLEVAEPR